MLTLLECAGRTDVGRKAERLSRALRRGMRVPDGVVLLPDGPIDEGQLKEVLLSLGGDRFAVRSSAEAEDRPGRSAAGLFLSLLAVPAEEAGVAALQVRASGSTAIVKQYLGGPARVAVLIQPQLPAKRLGVIHLSPDGGACAEERAPDEPEWGESVPRDLSRKDAEALLAAARTMAALLEEEPAPLGGAQIEYALLADGQVYLLQVRPAPTARRREAEPWPAPDLVHSYRLDREHNPDPLSPAQASLVGLVEEVLRPLGLSQRVVRSYLYFARIGPGPAGLPASELPRLKDVLSRCGARLAPLEALSAPPFAEAIAAYREILGCYLGEIGPTLRRVRGLLDDRLRAHLGEGLEQHGALLGGLETATQRRLQALWTMGRAETEEARGALLSAYLREHGATSPLWDVSANCDDEIPKRVLAQAAALSVGSAPKERQRAAAAAYKSAAAALQARLPAAARVDFLTQLSLARDAAVLAEDDDALFFRAQRLIRRALLVRGVVLSQTGRLDDPEQVFALPVDLLLDNEHLDLKDRVAAAERAQAAMRRLVPPDRFVAGQPVWRLSPGPILRGRGVPGPDPAPVRGRVQLIAALDELCPPVSEGAVLVLPALLPSWAPQVLLAAALVTDCGGALSHGATLAQEAGVPAVVGVRGATELLRSGEEVLVDAVRGIVVRLSDA